MRFFLVAVTLAVCFLSFAMTKFRIYPVTIFTALFGFSIIGALLLFEDEQWRYLGILWMIAALVFANIGFLACYGKPDGQKSDQLHYMDMKINRPIARAILLLLIGCGFLWLGIELSTNHLTFSVFTSPDSLLEASTEFAERRYSGGTSTSIIVQLLTGLTYSAALCGGSFYLMFDARKDRAICIGTMLPISLLMILTNAKAGFVASMMLWLVGYTISYIKGQSQGISIFDKSVVLFLCIALVVFVLLFAAFLLRAGSLESWAFDSARKRLGIYAFAGIYNFDYWFSTRGFSLLDAQFGSNTFMSAFSLLGLVERSQGVYQDLLSGYGNIFTACRGLVQDFTSIGGLLIQFIIGCIEGHLVKRIHSDQSPLAQVCLAAIGFFYAFSIFISPWVYTTFVMPFVILFTSLHMCRVQRSKNVIS